MSLTKFNTKEAATAYLWANYESDSYPAASTGVGRVILIGPTSAKHLGIDAGFYINIELDDAGL